MKIMYRKEDIMMNDKYNNQGFTLIEVLIALAVFAIGILGVFTLQITAIKGNASARGVTENYLSGMDKVEELMARSFDDPLLAAGGPYTLADDADGIDNDGDGTVDEAGENGYINIQWQVQDNTMWEQTIKLVTVTVTSTVNGSRQKTISFDFLKAQL
jgi:type IV pilus assembly protein PilV